MWICKSCETFHEYINNENKELKKIVKNTQSVLAEEDMLVNADLNNRLEENINVSHPRVEVKVIINTVSSSISISAGSACTTANVEPSHVIMALG